MEIKDLLQFFKEVTWSKLKNEFKDEHPVLQAWFVGMFIISLISTLGIFYGLYLIIKKYLGK